MIPIEGPIEDQIEGPIEGPLIEIQKKVCKFKNIMV